MAKAGAGSIQVSKANPFECLRVPDERMPMLFMIPRPGSNGGDYAMLGLGPCTHASPLVHWPTEWGGKTVSEFQASFTIHFHTETEHFILDPSHYQHLGAQTLCLKALPFEVTASV